MRVKIKGGMFVLCPIAILLILTLFGFIYPNSILGYLKNWLFVLILMVTGTLAAFALEYETKNLTSKEISLVAILSGMSAVTRVPFAAIPSVQPCTYLIICTGYVFGPVSGFMAGATTALVSNMFLGHGPWTPFQMFAWGLVGASSSILGHYKIKKWGLIIWGCLWGYFFGWIMNLWFWIAFVYPLTFSTFAFTYIQSFWFDTAHAIGNIVFLSAFGERTIILLQRYKRRFQVDFKRPSMRKVLNENNLSL